MERLMDKLIVAVACAALMVSYAASAAGVGVLLVCVTASCALELVPARCGRIALALVPSALAIAFPSAAPVLPVSAYDLAALSAPWLQTVPVVAWILSIRSSASVEELVLTAGFSIASALLARRTSTTRQARELVNRERDALSERSQSLERKNRDLLDARAYELRVAVLEERSRIAREIHDNVGHLLTRSILQARAYQVVHGSAPEVATAFGALAATLDEALDQVRSSVHDLRDDAIDLSVQIDRAVASFALDTDCSIDAGAAPHAVCACCVAVVREALSNTARHSDADHVSVRLVEHPGFWQLAVNDNGSRPPDEGVVTTGMGLASMAERVSALGGTFRAWYDAGFHVFATIPKPDAPGSQKERAA